MLGARHTEDGVIYRNQKLGRLSFKPSRERWLADVLDEVVFDQTPELPRRDPDASFVTDDFCRMFRHTDTSKYFARIGNLRLEQF